MATNQEKISSSEFSELNSGKQSNSDFYIETAPGVNIYVQDYGQGKPVILIHGWPLSNEMWEYQIENLVENNFRVITYDRRGFGKSSKPWFGYDYDSLTNDLNAIIEQLNLENITVVGFSMGAGEVARYFSRFYGKGVSKAVLISSILPFLLKTDDNPDGVPEEHNEETTQKIKEDRISFLENFGKTFFGLSLINKPISSDLLNYYKMLASFASPRATLECAKSFSTTDFREEMVKINVPTLIIHGDEDKTVPIGISSERAAVLIPENTYLVYEDAPHGLFYTDKERLNDDLLAFLNS